MSASLRTSAPIILDAGDSALVMELGATIDEQVNARAVAAAAWLREAHLSGVRDVVPTYAAVAVFFDPLTTDAEAVRQAMVRAREASPCEADGPIIEIPVAYGGEAGPDLVEVARWAGMSPDEVIERHASRTYRVFMLGFLPGFAYMGTVEEAIAAPRLATPRVRVPAGSVGIAGGQTGIYSTESPGGWQIIGRTPVSVFDAIRTPASMFAPGDRVRFVSAGAAPAVRQEAPDEDVRNAIAGRPFAGRPEMAGRRSITVVRPGLFTTIQDGGRWGYQAQGVPVAGPMDPVAHRVANALVGNPADAATLEATILGPELRLETEAMLGVAGADLGVTLDGAQLPPGHAARGAAGSVLRFSRRVHGTRAYVAFDGGVDVPPILGSRATYVPSGLGGIDGRALKVGDVLPLRSADRSPAGSQDRGLTSVMDRLKAGGARVRVIAGPQSSFFEPGTLESLQRSRFTISPQSDRMGYRLTGARIPRASREMISGATFTGALQVPASGDPILLMADRQVTGGYPQIAVVITADLPVVGQLAPGDWVEFEICTRAEAIAALAEQEQCLVRG
ncbi:MAG: 5-oxoprolinase subunit PxpB [Vicinamibacterales bacterium]